jgi:magnesium transporter
MIRCIQITKSSNSFTEISLLEARKAIDDPKNLIWVSLESATTDEINLVLGDTFTFHPLTIEDCLSDGYQIAKVDDFEDYLFIIANAVNIKETEFDLDSSELDIFLGSNYLVSCFTSARMTPVDRVWKRLLRDRRVYNHGADFLCHALLDALVDEYMPVTDDMENEIEQLEDTVLQKPNPAVLERLLTLKHSIVSLRRMVSPLREVVNRMARDDYAQIEPTNRIYFRDVYDHLIWILDIAETIRDIVSGAMDIYLNSTSLRLNEVMKALTIVSTIFLPLAFVTGLFGMNFIHIPGLSHPLGFWTVCCICLLISGGMIYFFKKRQWF